jgi:hypothetical protein
LRLAFEVGGIGLQHLVNKGTQKVIEEQLNNEQNHSNNLQNQINNHVCPVANAPDCPYPHDDYSQIIEQRDKAYREKESLSQELSQVKVEKDQALKAQETQIIHQLNQDLKLGLKELTLKETISKIQELINKPPTY